MSKPREKIEAKLGLTGPPLQSGRDRPPPIPDHELVRCIGHGAYGEVWLARNAFGTWRAVKIVYRDNFKEARPYEREFAGIRRFEPLSRSNEGFVDILQVGRFDPARRNELGESQTSESADGGGWFYYVMELADDAEDNGLSRDELREAGGVHDAGDLRGHDTRPFGRYVPRTLGRDVHQRGRLPLEKCLELGLTLTLALGHLHRHGLIHRDVKPSNIIYVGGIPKLADIGLVTEAQGANTFVGTEGFVPPEGPTSPQADLYALGKVLYEAAMGKDRNEFPEPFTHIGSDGESVALMELNAVLLRACAPDPRKRYASAEEMHADLALLHSGGSVRRQRKLARQLRFVQRACAVVAALAGVVACGWFYHAQKSREILALMKEKLHLAEENARLSEFERLKLLEDRFIKGANESFYFLAGPITNPANGHLYYLLDNALPSQAVKFARELGGELATVRSAEEQSWLVATFAKWKQIPRNLFIGFYHFDPRQTAASFEERRSQFRWMSGEPVTYTNWRTNEPNGWEAEPERFVHIYPDDGTWNDFGDVARVRGIGVHGVVEVIPHHAK